MTNAIGIPGRIAPGWIADHFLGPLNTLIVVVALSGLLTYVWAAVTTIEGTWAFAVLYGLFGAGITSMFPPALANAQKDSSKIGVRMGMIFSVMSIGCLCGPPIAGVLIDQDGENYLYAQMFGGSVMMLGAIVFMVPRTLGVGWSPFKKI